MKFFEDLIEEKGFVLNEQARLQFQTYFKLLIEWNDKINLTAITDEQGVYLKHFYDSLTASFFYDFNSELSLCDVGAGAGFPSIPLKILFPHIHVTIVDSLNKRIKFLEELTQELGLTNMSLYHDRAETFGQNKRFRESYDVVTARAVAKLNVLSEFCLPLAKEDGVFIALKGALGEEEVNESLNAISVLGGKLDSIHSITLPEEESQRQIILINKQKPTPKKYPRKPGMPIKQPL
ncbi:16S rRNA (guanine(527)-N(7))-methyltransferase RsmG [Pullulanibacillus sp. KACC 23026]|uniref:16S rRNA (guanine(527)-N(7))-methyltransferase RsmG n=1 Tax=Pullulanibacillus sp. KACC 23026 TaxID=3028315 RepID=UPI0023AF1CA8|nr:16S rRNA (guanine(527)-N(7))-methyltransferase RsmG [Pullulanibacillus sp. KACC 23026]WEG12788.1 16S rRNA (guanine(527)-N(7))-methyltransferase RsmG [Pullulanibacillus sp. KACC 23026]